MITQVYLSAEEVRQALRRIYHGDTESNLPTALIEAFSDELRPLDQKGGRKLSPLLVLSFFLLCALVGVFVFFSVGGRG